MLKVFGPDREKIGEFKSYEELITFINSERLLSQTNLWSYFHHTPEDVKRICALKRPEYITIFEFKALEKSYGLLEIRRGPDRSLRQIIVTPELDVQNIQKNWCLECCRSSEWFVIEVMEPKQGLRSLASSEGSPSSLPSLLPAFQNRLLSRKPFCISNQLKILREQRRQARMRRTHLFVSQSPKHTGGQ